MNTKTHTQAGSAATLEVADPAKNLILVPLAQLRARRSRRNARRAPRQSIPELAVCIERIGLLQNLIVVAVEGGEYEVVAGDRRLTALKWLAKKRRIAAVHEVPCLLVPDASARTASLAENAMREAMHPADEFEAFAALVREGRPVEGIDADFGVSPLVVQRRLRLGNVSPRLLADYPAGAATLEQLMALTITDDHAAQEAAFYDAPEWQRGASALRERLTACEIDATHPLARFVGLEAYEAAGGALRRDLFADDARGTYLADAALLERLVRDRLKALAGKVRAEGWAWVEAVPHLSRAGRRRSRKRRACRASRPRARRGGSHRCIAAWTRPTRRWKRPARPRTTRASNRWNSGASRWSRNALQKAWCDPLPHDGTELFAGLVAKPQDTLVQLLAICVASTVDVVTLRADRPPAGTQLAQAVGLDMAAWWTPTAEGYFQHVSKAAILDAVAQYAPPHVRRPSKLSKGEIAREAGRLAEGTGWMPAVYRQESGSAPASMTSGDATVDDEVPALAA